MTFLAKEMLLIKTQIFAGDTQLKYPIISFLQISKSHSQALGKQSSQGPLPWPQRPAGL